MLNIDIGAKKKEKAGRGVGNMHGYDEGVGVLDRVTSEGLTTW